MPNDGQELNETQTTLEPITEEGSDVVEVSQGQNSSKDSSPAVKTKHIKKSSISGLDLVQTPKEPTKRRASVRSDALTGVNLDQLEEAAEFTEKRGIQRRDSKTIAAEAARAVKSEEVVNVTFIPQTNRMYTEHFRFLAEDFHKQSILALFRSINPYTHILIQRPDVKAKTMRVKGKSAIFGPVAGLITLDTKLSKSKTIADQGKFQEKNIDVINDSKKRLAELLKKYQDSVKSSPDSSVHEAFVKEFNDAEIVESIVYQVEEISVFDNQKKKFKLVYLVDEAGEPELEDGKPKFLIEDVKNVEVKLGVGDKPAKVRTDVVRTYRKYDYETKKYEEYHKKPEEINTKDVEVIIQKEIELDEDGKVKESEGVPTQKQYYITPDYDLLTMAVKSACDWFQNIDLEGIYELLSHEGEVSNENIKALSRKVKVLPEKMGEDVIDESEQKEYKLYCLFDENDNIILDENGQPTTCVKISAGLLKPSELYQYDHATKSISSTPIKPETYAKPKAVTFKDLWAWATRGVALEEMKRRIEDLEKDDKFGFVTPGQKRMLQRMKDAINSAINHGLDAYNPDPPEINDEEDFIIFIPEDFWFYKDSPFTVKTLEGRDGSDSEYKYVIIGGTGKKKRDIKRELCEFINLARSQGYSVPVNPRWNWLKKSYNLSGNISRDGVVSYIKSEFQVVEDENYETFYKKADKLLADLGKKLQKKQEELSADEIEVKRLENDIKLFKELIEARYKIEMYLLEAPVHFSDLDRSKQEVVGRISNRELQDRINKVEGLGLVFAEKVEELSGNKEIARFFEKKDDPLSLMLRYFRDNPQKLPKSVQKPDKWVEAEKKREEAKQQKSSANLPNQ